MCGPVERCSIEDNSNLLERKNPDLDLGLPAANRAPILCPYALWVGQVGSGCREFVHTRPPKAPSKCSIWQCPIVFALGHSGRFNTRTMSPRHTLYGGCSMSNITGSKRYFAPTLTHPCCITHSVYAPAEKAASCPVVAKIVPDGRSTPISPSRNH